MSERTQIELGLIDPNPYQPRMAEDPELVERLALSIGRDGLLQPPAARRVNGRYQLAFGHTRLAAFRWLVANNYGEDFARMPLELVDLSDEAMYRHAVTENLQRKDLTPIEEARAMKRAMEDFGYNSQQVGLLFGKNDATVRGKIRLLELDADFQAKLAAGEMSEGAARNILAVQKVLTPEKKQELIDSGARTVDEIVSYEIDNTYGLGRRLIRMHSRWSSGDPTGGPGLWPLKWTFETPPWSFPTDKQFAKLWDGEQERNGRRVADMATEFRQAITTIIPGHAKSWEKLYEVNGEHWSDVLDLLKQLAQPPACTACDYYIKQVYRFVWDQAAALFGEVFKGLSLGVLDDLRTPCRAPKGCDFDTLSPQARAAYMLLYARYDDDLADAPYHARTITPVQDAARHLQGVAKAWGVKLPGDWLDLAAGYEPEGLAALIAAVAVETDED